MTLFLEGGHRGSNVPPVLVEAAVALELLGSLCCRFRPVALEFSRQPLLQLLRGVVKGLQSRDSGRRLHELEAQMWPALAIAVSTISTPAPDRWAAASRIELPDMLQCRALESH